MAKKPTAPEVRTGPRRVRALKPGFYGCLREVGEVFVLAPGVPFSTIWMQDVDDDTPISRAPVVPLRPLVPLLQPNGADPIATAGDADEAPTGDADVLGARD